MFPCHTHLTLLPTDILESMLRSLMYAHFSETLTGLPTIRSYGKTKQFIEANRYYIDLQDRGLFITITNQRWLGVRLDFMSATLIFFVRSNLGSLSSSHYQGPQVALLTILDVSGINPAQIGVVLTYVREFFLFLFT